MTTDGQTGLTAAENAAVSSYLALRPFDAAVLGEPGWSSQLLPAVSEAEQDDVAARARKVLADLDHIEPASLSAEDQLTLAMMTELTGYDVAALAARSSRYLVSPVPEAGLTAGLLLFLPQASIRTDTDLQSFARALRLIPAVLDDSLAALAAGRRAGQHPVGRLAVRAAEQIDQYLAMPLATDPYVAAARAAPDAAAGQLADEVLHTVTNAVRPAFQRYRDALVTDVLPLARDCEHPGLRWLPDGSAAYHAAVRAHTTLEVSPGQVHEAGRELIAATQHEAAEVAAALGWDSGFAAIRDRMRGDRSLYFASAQEMIAAADVAMRRAIDAVPEWICELPAARCDVQPMTELETRNGVIGRYQSAPLDRSAPGRYWLNIRDPGSRPRYEAEALAHHESVPGHHIEIASSQEAAISSRFRKLAEVTPYREGWALYMERFADEIGLYSGPLDRLGMLSFQLWRAGRLVVDTGLHEYGWSRARAVSYLLDNTILTADNAGNEVDRYIACPGQALGYMTGQLAFRQLRAAAVRDSASAAQHRAFHSQVLAHGPLTLRCLSRALGTPLAVLT